MRSCSTSRSKFSLLAGAQSFDIQSTLISRILEGDHIPSGGQKSANADNLNEVGEPKEYEYEYYDDTPQESPFVNPHDPNHQNVRSIVQLLSSA